MFTLRRLLANVKDEDEPEDWCGAVYKTKDSTARWGKKLTLQQNERKLATKKGDLNNNSAEHHLKTSHTWADLSLLVVDFKTKICRC